MRAEKQCSSCEDLLPVSHFGTWVSKKTNKRYFKSHCYSCINERQNSRRSNSLSQHQTRERSNSKERRAALSQFVWSSLEGKKCSSCEEADPLLLDFDHIKRESKVVAIADAVNRKWSIAKIKEEMDKCQILCVRCHRYKTAHEANWARLTYSRSEN